VTLLLNSISILFIKSKRRSPNCVINGRSFELVWRNCHSGEGQRELKPQDYFCFITTNRNRTVCNIFWARLPDGLAKAQDLIILEVEFQEKVAGKTIYALDQSGFGRMLVQTERRHFDILSCSVQLPDKVRLLEMRSPEKSLVRVNLQYKKGGENASWSQQCGSESGVQRVKLLLGT